VIPVSDSPPRRTFPYINIALIAASILVFIYELTLPSVEDVNRFFVDYGVIPVQLTDWVKHPRGLGEPMTVFTSAFIHGGWLHLAGNMIYLWVFGDNVEDALGHLKYLLFYAVAAVGAVALQVAMDSDSIVPMVGASGAISGVMGAYVVLYAKARIEIIIPWLWFLGTFRVPAIFLIGFWFLLQLMSGIATIGTATGASEGIAVWAHVGGFLTGLVLMLWLMPFARQRPAARRSRTGMW
jgi:membrane associated rhomboid family serine protease